MPCGAQCERMMGSSRFKLKKCDGNDKVIVKLLGWP